MLNWKYAEDGKRIILTDGEPKRKKKVTGTRLGALVGLNPWKTPFQIWCEITKCAEPAFEDTIYTLAGKAIEPKQIEYTKKSISDNVLSPLEFFGNRMDEVRYDFYPESKVYGGMWDSKLVRPSGKVSDIFEYKTSSRPQDWVTQVPVYYLLQVLEYAYLEKAKRVHLVVSFLDKNDYNNPDNFVVSDKNTQIFTFEVDKTYVNIETGAIVETGEKLEAPYMTIKGIINYADAWYEKYIKTGVSPKFDETKDKEYLDILRTNKPQNDLGEADLVTRANALREQIEAIREQNHLDELEKALKSCENGIKENLMKDMGENDTKAVLGNYTLSKTLRTAIVYDDEAMKEDGIFDKYAVEEVKATYTLRKSKN